MPTNATLYILLLICISGFTRTNGDPNIGHTDEQVRLYDEWNKINMIIFNKGDQVLEPTETLKHLQRLNEIFPTVQPMLGRTNAQFWLQHKKLIGLANVSGDKCTFKILYLFDSKLNAEHEYKGTLMPFLKHYRREQYKICEQVLREKLEETISKLPKRQLDDVEQLTGEVLKFEKDFNHKKRPGKILEFSSDNLAKGSLNHLRKRIQELSSATRREDFERMFGDLIINLCLSSYNELETAARFYVLLSKASGKELGTLTGFNWTVSEKMCSKLTRESMNSIIDLAFNHLGQLKPANRLNQGGQQRAPARENGDTRPKNNNKCLTCFG